MRTQKTWKGKTAGGWLKTAEAAPCEAGMSYVWIAGYQAFLADDGDLCITGFSGDVVYLETSRRAYRTMRRLERLAEKQNLKKYSEAF
jgi:hypothetical protein